MKKLIFAFTAIFTLSAFTTIAQESKFAHVNTETVLDSVASYKAIMAEQEDMSDDYQKSTELIQKQIQEIQIEVMSRQDTSDVSDIEMQLYQNDVENKQKQLQLIDQEIQRSFGVLQERMEKIMSLYSDAVAIVAERMDLTYVFYKFEEGQQVMYIGPKSADISKEVMIEMLRMDNEKRIHEYDQ